MKQTAWDHDLLLESPYPVITEEPVSWGRKGERLTLAERHKAIVEANSGKVFSIITGQKGDQNHRIKRSH